MSSTLLKPEIIKIILHHFQIAIDFPIVLLDMQGTVLGKTMDVDDIVIQECVQSLSSSDKQQILDLHNAYICTCTIQEKQKCQLLFFSRMAKNYFPFADTVIKAVFRQRSSMNAVLRMDPKSILVNQLSNTDRTNTEINAIIKNLGYTAVDRYAIVFSISHQAVELTTNNFYYLEQKISEIIERNEYTCSEDIYGLVNTMQYIIFKKLDGNHNLRDNQELKTYLDTLIPDIEKQLHVKLKVTIGTIYSQFLELQESYREAMFLQKHFDFLATQSENSYLLLYAYIFEYLVSLLPNEYWESQFKSFSCKTKHDPRLLETIIGLSRNNMVLSACAYEFGLHRNTVLKRYNTLQEMLSLNPLYYDHDRALLRAFSLFNNKKISLNAGIVIQPNSIVHQGMQKVADLIAQKSNGTMVLNIHTFSVSGDNRLLFDTICRGSLDIAVVTPNELKEATNNQSSILELPFLFDSCDEARNVLNSQLLQTINTSLEAAGVTCLGFWTMGWRFITSNKHPIITPGDIKHKRMRIMHNNTLENYFYSMGTQPIKMNYGDVEEALATNVIDCQENPYSNILEMGFYKYQKYITQLKYFLSIESCLISLSRLNALTKEQQRIIFDAMAETTPWVYAEQQLLNDNSKEILENEKGMIVVEPSQEQIQLWRKYSNMLYEKAQHKNVLKQIIKAKNIYHAKKRNS